MQIEEATCGFGEAIAAAHHAHTSHDGKTLWVNVDGTQIPGPTTTPSAETIAEGTQIPDLASLSFRDPNNFRAGEIHRQAAQWEMIVGDDENGALVMKWVRHGVDIHDFMTPFQGEFQGEYHDCEVVPQKVLPNSKITVQFDSFISQTIIDRVRSGAVRVWGKVGQVEAPRVVSPITIEPTRPRMCIDMRFVNNWMKKTPFNLDSLTDIPRIASRGSFMTKLDDKSGYDHMAVTEASSTFFGFQWKGWYFVCRCIPFGWRNSAFIYQSLNLQPVSYLRRLGVPMLLYIDDRWVEQWQGIWKAPPLAPLRELHKGTSSYFHDRTAVGATGFLSWAGEVYPAANNRVTLLGPAG